MWLWARRASVLVGWLVGGQHQHATHLTPTTKTTAVDEPSTSPNFPTHQILFTAVFLPLFPFASLCFLSPDRPDHFASSRAEPRPPQNGEDQHVPRHLRQGVRSRHLPPPAVIPAARLAASRLALFDFDPPHLHRTNQRQTAAAAPPNTTTTGGYHGDDDDDRAPRRPTSDPISRAHVRHGHSRPVCALQQAAPKR